MTERRSLGGSGIEVSPIGLGVWQFSQRANLAGRFWEKLGPETMDGIVRVSLEGGIDWFDTAQVYGGGLSEEALAHALRAAGRAPGEVVVATKWWPLLRTAGSIRRTFPERRRRLDPFPVDLHQVHFPFSISSIRAQMDAMADLCEAGEIRAVGVSNFSARQMRKAHAALARRGLPLATNQVEWSILDRRPEANGVLGAARELGVTIIAYSPLAQGLVTGRFHDDPGLVKRRPGFRRWRRGFRRKGLARSRPVVEALREIGSARGATPAQVALAWLVRAHGDGVVAIPGATRPEQARENAAAMGLALTAAEISRLDAVSRPFLG